MELSVSVVPGGASYPNHVAWQRGPQVLALEAAVNPQIRSLHRAAPTWLDAVQLTDASPRLPKAWAGTQAYAIPGLASQLAGPGRQEIRRMDLILIPFAEARDYRVWLPRPERMPVGRLPVTAFARESWSRPGNLEGSICDDRPDTFRVTSNGAQAHEDWYAVTLDQPTLIGRVVYQHGRSFADGGWFNTAAGKPRIQVRRSADGDWETVATLDNYPDTGANGRPGIRDGQPFEATLKTPVRVFAIRVLGRPGGAFSSCAELAAFAP
jgi:hypothetical protein